MGSTCASVQIGARVTNEVLLSNSSSAEARLSAHCSVTRLADGPGSGVSIVSTGRSVEDRLLGYSPSNDNDADGEIFDDDEEAKGSHG